MEFFDRTLTLRGSLTLLLALVGCVAGCSQEQDPATAGKPPQTDEPPRVLGTLPDFKLTDQIGGTFDRDAVLGKAWIANFIFTRCGSTCPMQTVRMAEMQKTLMMLPEWGDIRFVSFTVDPEFDTPEVLAAYARQYGADPEHWKFVTGTREALWNLSKKGFKLDVGEEAKTEVMPIYHSSRFVLVDRSARIRGYYDGLAEEGLNKLRADLNHVLAEPGPTKTATPAPTAASPKQFPYPKDVLNPSWLEPRRQAQVAAKTDYNVFCDFQFADRVESSGITFEHVSVDDADRLQPTLAQSRRRQVREHHFPRSRTRRSDQCGRSHRGRV